MCNEKGCSGSVILAFLAGGLIGAGLALLYAPMAGSEARQKIGDFAGDLRKKAEGWTDEMKKKVESMIEEEKSVVRAAYEAGREAMAKEKARFETPE